jgi:hypothetical protein
MNFTDMPGKMLVPICAVGLIAACSTMHSFDKTADAFAETRLVPVPLARAFKTGEAVCLKS